MTRCHSCCIKLAGNHNKNDAVWWVCTSLLPQYCSNLNHFLSGTRTCVALHGCLQSHTLSYLKDYICNTFTYNPVNNSIDSTKSCINILLDWLIAIDCQKQILERGLLKVMCATLKETVMDCFNKEVIKIIKEITELQNQDNSPSIQ